MLRSFVNTTKNRLSKNNTVNNFNINNTLNVDTFNLKKIKR